MNKVFNKLMPVLVLSLLILASAADLYGSAAEPTGSEYLSMQNAGRVQTVTALINGAKQGGVTIKQTPVSYCKKLDAFYVKHPDMKKQSLAVVLKTLIIMEYDWSQKVVDKDALARQFLGEKLYQENKVRLKK